jgi:hypothetical protein
MVITREIKVIHTSIVLLDLVFFANTDMNRVANAQIACRTKILGWGYDILVIINIIGRVRPVGNPGRIITPPIVSRAPGGRCAVRPMFGIYNPTFGKAIREGCLN